MTAGTGTGQPVTSQAAAAQCSPAHLSQPLAVPGINSIKALLYFGTNELFKSSFLKQRFSSYKWLTDGRDTGKRTKRNLGEKGNLKFLGGTPRYKILWGF